MRATWVNSFHSHPSHPLGATNPRRGPPSRPPATAVQSVGTSDSIREGDMTITVEATYENGVLKPAKPLPLDEHEQVQVTVVRGASVAEQTYGLMGWTGDA